MPTTSGAPCPLGSSACLVCNLGARGPDCTRPVGLPSKSGAAVVFLTSSKRWAEPGCLAARSRMVRTAARLPALQRGVALGRGARRGRLPRHGARQGPLHQGKPRWQRALELSCASWRVWSATAAAGPACVHLRPAPLHPSTFVAAACLAQPRCVLPLLLHGTCLPCRRRCGGASLRRAPLTALWRQHTSSRSW